jgi:hypothetical protein
MGSLGGCGGQRRGVSGAGEAVALEALRFDWDTAYRITVEDGQWLAWRRDGKGGALAADTPDELRRAIVNDYVFLPVPRDLP